MRMKNAGKLVPDRASHMINLLLCQSKEHEVEPNPAWKFFNKRHIGLPGYDLVEILR